MLFLWIWSSRDFWNWFWAFLQSEKALRQLRSRSEVVLPYSHRCQDVMGSNVVTVLVDAS